MPISYRGRRRGQIVSKPAGVILCGGQSRRMGQPKALLDFHGQPLLLRMLAVLAPKAGPLVVVAAPEQELPTLPLGVLVARDTEPHLGPLAGIAAGLEALPDGCDWAFVSACDSPLLASGWIDLLMSRREDADIVMPVADGREPAIALYRRRIAVTARELLAADRRRPVFCASDILTSSSKKWTCGIDPI